MDVSEIKMLQDIAEAASDLVLALRDQEFSKLAGGVDYLALEVQSKLDRHAENYMQTDCRNIPGG